MQSRIQLRPGIAYLTLRCVLCGLVYDAKVPSGPAIGPETGSAKAVSTDAASTD
ncbi:MAG: hypothetical protein WCB02_21790 [Bradyrhizobium sp.]